MNLRSATQNDPSALHVSQKLFWFSVSFCLILGTGFFCWRLWHDATASIKLFGVEITCDAAQKSVQATRDRLVAVRTRLHDAAEQNDVVAIQGLLPDLDRILKTLGVAESALKDQRRKFISKVSSYDTYEATDYFSYTTDYQDYGYNDYQKGPAKPSPSPKK